VKKDKANAAAAKKTANAAKKTAKAAAKAAAEAAEAASILTSRLTPSATEDMELAPPSWNVADKTNAWDGAPVRRRSSREIKKKTTKETTKEKKRKRE
jgi:hypothetical protein